MQKSKLVTLLGALKPGELSAFAKHLKKNYANEKPALAVFNYLKKHHPGFENQKKLEAGYVHRAVFKKDISLGSNDRKRLLNLLSDLYKWLKEYLLWEKVKSGAFENNAAWVGILNERQLLSKIRRPVAQLRGEVEAMSRTSVTDYMKGMTANYFFYYYQTQNKSLPHVDTLEHCVHDMDLFYAVSRLKVACEMANRSNVLSLDFDAEALPAVLELVKTTDLSNHPLLQLYLKLYDLIAKREGQRFNEIKELLTTFGEAISPDEQHTTLSYLHNYAALQIRQGKESFWRMAHSINEYHIGNEDLMKLTGLSAVQFLNIVTTACKARDFKWAIRFIKNCQGYLRKPIRPNTVALAHAIVHFEKKEYRKVLAKTKDLKFRDLFNSMRCRSLVLMSHFELNSHEVDILEVCSTFEQHLRRRKKNRQAAVRATFNFLGVVKMLARENAGKEKIMQRIESTRPLYFEGWLREKATLYKKR